MDVKNLVLLGCETSTQKRVSTFMKGPQFAAEDFCVRHSREKNIQKSLQRPYCLFDPPLFQQYRGLRDSKELHYDSGRTGT